MQSAVQSAVQDGDIKIAVSNKERHLPLSKPIQAWADEPVCLFIDTPHSIFLYKNILRYQYYIRCFTFTVPIETMAHTTMVHFRDINCFICQNS